MENKFARMTLETKLLADVAHELWNEADAFEHSLDRDNYTQVVGLYHRLSDCLARLDKDIPKHWNIEPVPVSRAMVQVVTKKGTAE